MSVCAKSYLTISYLVANCNVSQDAKLEGGNYYPATTTFFYILLIFFQCFHGQSAERPPVFKSDGHFAIILWVENMPVQALSFRLDVNFT